VAAVDADPDPRRRAYLEPGTPSADSSPPPSGVNPSRPSRDRKGTSGVEDPVGRFAVSGSERPTFSTAGQPGTSGTGAGAILGPWPMAGVGRTVAGDRVGPPGFAVVTVVRPLVRFDGRRVVVVVVVRRGFSVVVVVRRGFSVVVVVRRGFSVVVVDRRGFSVVVVDRRGFSVVVVDRRGFSVVVVDRRGFSVVVVERCRVVGVGRVVVGRGFSVVGVGFGLSVVGVGFGLSVVGVGFSVVGVGFGLSVVGVGFSVVGVGFGLSVVGVGFSVVGVGFGLSVVGVGFGLSVVGVGFGFSVVGVGFGLSDVGVGFSLGGVGFGFSVVGVGFCDGGVGCSDVGVGCSDVGVGCWPGAEDVVGSFFASGPASAPAGSAGEATVSWADDGRTGTERPITVRAPPTSPARTHRRVGREPTPSSKDPSPSGAALKRSHTQRPSAFFVSSSS
jgi:hypothetical protein